MPTERFRIINGEGKLKAIQKIYRFPYMFALIPSSNCKEHIFTSYGAENTVIIFFGDTRVNLFILLRPFTF
jgi:hypothetical protein